MVGDWLTQGREGVIRIAPCNGNLCGTLVGLRFGSNGDAPRDWQGRSQCGLTIMTGMAQVQPGLWRGHIVNPQDGKRYGVDISLESRNRLRLRGFLDMPVLSAIKQSQIWTRFLGRLTPDCHMLS